MRRTAIGQGLPRLPPYKTLIYRHFSMYYPPLRTLYYIPLAVGLLGACSSPQSPGNSATGSPDPTATPPKFSYGAKVDSLNGIPGHTFGQPLRAFPKMETFAPELGVLTRTYGLPDGVAGTWFARHRAQVPYQYLDFLDGQLYRFRAVGEPAALKAEATYLLGPGQVEGERVFWEGERARAAYSEQVRGLGREGRLDIVSKPLEAAQQAKAQAQLKADNAQ